MYTIEVERTLVRSPHEVWDRLCDGSGIARFLGGVQIGTVEPPTRMEWSFRGATGVIELEEAQWGTRVRARVKSAQVPAWERLTTRYEIEQALARLFAELGTHSLQGRGSRDHAAVRARRDSRPAVKPPQR